MDDGIRVVRIWRRDHSTNIMSLDDAAWNLKGNAVPLMHRNWEIERIKDRLLTGHKMETPLAVFHVIVEGLNEPGQPLLEGKNHA